MLGWASQLLRAKAQKRTTSPSQPFPAPLLPDLCCCAGRSIRRTTSSPSCSREPLLGGQQNSSAAGAGPLSGAGVRAKLSPAGISSQWGTRGCRVQGAGEGSQQQRGHFQGFMDLWLFHKPQSRLSVSQQQLLPQDSEGMEPLELCPELPPHS